MPSFRPFPNRADPFWIAAFTLFFCWFSWRIGGDGTPDFRAYHLYNGYTLAQGGRPQDIAAAQLQTFFFPGLDLLYWALFRALDAHPALLRLLLGLPYAAAATAVFAIGLRMMPPEWPLRRPLAAGAALFGTTGAAGFATIGTTMSEIVPGLPVLAALCLWRPDGEGMDGRSRTLRVLGAGVLCGISVGLKLTALPLFVGMLAAILLCGCPDWRRAATEAALFLGAGLITTFAIAGWWWARNYAELGNPIFPAFNDLFRSDLVEPGRWSDDRFKPRNWAMALLYPAYWAFRVTHWAIELPMRDPRSLIALLSAIAVLLAIPWSGRGRPAAPHARSAAFVAVFFLTTYLLWEIQFSIYRYLAVPETLTGALALAAAALWVRPRLRLAASAALILVALLAVRVTVYPWWDRSLPSTRVLEVALPAIPPDAMVVFLDPYAFSYTVPFMPRPVRVIGANTNLVHPGAPGRLAGMIETAIRGHDGPFWGMENPQDFPGIADATLAHYGLSRAEGCVPLRTNVEIPRIIICPLQRNR